MLGAVETKTIVIEVKEADNTEVWIQSNGKGINVKDMTDKHIVNTVILFGKERLELMGYNNILERFESIRNDRDFLPNRIYTSLEDSDGHTVMVEMTNENIRKMQEALNRVTIKEDKSNGNSR